jgi:hypothetical protein
VIAFLTEYGTRVVGIALLAAAAAAVPALLYRALTRERLGGGIPLLVALAAAAAYLNVRTALGEVALGSTQVLSPGVVAFNSVALLAAALASPVGAAVGDRVGVDLFAVGGAREIEGEVGRLVRAVGRVTALTVPEAVEDIEGYDPVPQATKGALAGTTLVFPRGTPVEERRDRLAARLRADHDVGYVDAEFDETGDLTRLAVGARQAGLGPTLGPGTGAVAVRADPPNAASAGDLVQVYRAGDPPERVATAEVRAATGDVVTLACDVDEARTLAGGDWRLVTLPAEPRAEREFASLLRTADETMATVTVAEGSALAAETVGDVAATVVAVRTATGDVAALPTRDRPLAAGETLYVVARPETIRELEARAA